MILLANVSNGWVSLLVRHVFNDPIEIVGVGLAVFCVWLTVRENVWCWPTGIATNVFFLILFVNSGLYADGGLQIVYVALGFYGWYLWIYGDPNRPRLPISRTSFSWAVGLTLAGCAILGSITWVLQRFTPSTVPFWDAGVVALCLVAQFMLGFKKLENWWVWIVSNLWQMGLYTYKEHYLTAGLQIILIAMSVQGFLTWRRRLHEQAWGS